MRLFREQPFSVPLHRAPSLALRDLEAATDRTAFHHLFRDRLVGDSSEDRIRIRRVRPLWRNDFAPRFAGRISDNGQMITGVFRHSSFARAFVTLWVSGLLILFLPVEVAQIAKDGWTQDHAQMLAMIFGLLGFGGFLMPWLGWWVGRSDIAMIEEALCRAAGHTGA